MSKVAELTHVTLSDSKWNGRFGYDSYYVPGTRDEVKAIYEKIRPVAQASPRLSFVREVSAGEELINGMDEPFLTPRDGWKINIERWAV